MKSFTYDELVEVGEHCVSRTRDPAALLAWVEALGISIEVLNRYAQTVARAGVLAAERSVEEGFSITDVLAGIYCSGFEFGVRFQQSREMVI